MSKDFDRLSDLVTTLNDTDNIGKQEELLYEISDLARYCMTEVQRAQFSCWVAIYDADPYSDYPCTDYVLLGECTKTTALERFNKRFFGDVVVFEEEGDDLELMAVDKDTYYGKWEPLKRYSNALVELEGLGDQYSQEIVDRLKALIEPLRKELGLCYNWMNVVD